ncbi:ABC transporter ATP-binding protein [Bradyrhizobium sp. AS23.2]|uniref:ABC transporter ATP-binding protein n=1 Tax=Bradyrhizobium sp. AS23.2 TaxID=1680155 RepID=UPI000938B7D3|nr:ABC transporter ATP-binding protein [Bradyrhizobium sp. AS23.2]OKO83038.1 ABC transporter [Bradyrhizobium sp. AS23.2]
MTLLLARDLAINFGGIKAVDGITFDVTPGEIFTIIGPNGAGKTTIFNLISRIYNTSAGRLVFDGDDITHTPPHQIAGRGIARTFQNVELFEHATLLQNMLLGQHAHRKTRVWEELLFLPRVRVAERHIRRRVEEVIEFLDLQRYRDAPVRDLPYGVRKVIELARALCTQPKLILLDEPSSGLNVEETEDLSFWIRDLRDDLGITVVMVEHDLALVNDVSDRVMAVNSGRLLTIGTPAEVQSHPDVVKAYLGG